MFKNKWLIFTVAITILIGCQSTSNKGKKEFDISQQLMASQKYSEAVSYLELAIQKEPKNEQYKAILANAKQKATSQIINEINQVLTSQPLNKSNIDLSKSLLMKAKKIDAQNSLYSQS